MELKTVSITRVHISDKSKDGKPFVTKTGKSYKKVGIQTEQYGAEWLSAFAWRSDDEVLGLNGGDVREILVERNGQYLNFRLPSRFDRLELRVTALEQFMLASNSDKKESSQDEPAIITADDLPF